MSVGEAHVSARCPRAGFPSTACPAAASQSAPGRSPAGTWMPARLGRSGGATSHGLGALGRGTGLGALPARGNTNSRPWPSAHERAAWRLRQAEPTLRLHKQKQCSTVKGKLLF